MSQDEDATRSLSPDATGSVQPDGPAATPVVRAGRPSMPAEGPAAERYRFLAKLGEGGMGVVWKVEDTRLGRIVALKRIKGDPSEGGVQVQRFLREAQLAARLHHPGIVGIHDSGEMDGSCYLTMEYVEGRSFAEYLRATQPEKETGSRASLARLREEIQHLAEVAEAVGHAHRMGIIHRDLKPGNVVLDADGRPRVMDFGLAKEVLLEDGGAKRAVREALTVQGAVVGTPAYMSPEQADADGGKVGPVTDVWALGVILYEILTGRRPFTGKNMVDLLAAVLGEDPVPPRSRHPHVPAELEAICLRALEKSVRKRYPNAGVLAGELRAWLAGEPVAARPLSGPARLRRTLQRHRTGTIVVVAALGILVALAWGGLARRAAAVRVMRIHQEIGATVHDLQTTLMTIEMSPAGREALARQPLKVLEALLEADPDFGPAHSWRGRIHGLLGHAADAEADLDRGCALAPDSPLVWYLRGMYTLQKYADSRGLPSSRMGDEGIRFAPPPAESESEVEWRTRGLADLERMATLATDDRTLGAEDLALGRATAALHGNLEDGPTLALAYLAGIDRPEAFRIRAFCLFRLERFPEAEAEASRAVEAWPADFVSWMRRAYARVGVALAKHVRNEDGAEDLRHAAADVDRALCLREPIAHLVGYRATIHYLLGIIHKRWGRDPRPAFRQSILDGRTALKLDPEDSYTTHTLAHALYSLSRNEHTRGVDLREELRTAASLYEKIARASPGDVEAHLNWTEAAAARAEAERQFGADARPSALEAVRAADRAIALAPEKADPRVRRANTRTLLAELDPIDSAAKREHRTLALADLDEAVRLEPESVLARHARGVFHRDGGYALPRSSEGARESYSRSLLDLDAAVALAPDNPSVHHARGILHYRIGLGEFDRNEDPSAAYERSLADLTRAIELDSGDPAPVVNRAFVRLAQGKLCERHGQDPADPYARALADAAAALERQPNLAKAHTVQGEVYFAQAGIADRLGTGIRENLNRAIDSFETAVRAGDADCLRPLGMVLALAERYDESLAVFARHAQCFPQQQAWAQDQIEHVTALKRQAIELNTPRPWKEAARLGWTAVAENAYVRAREHLREALELWERQSPAEKEEQAGIQVVSSERASTHYYYAVLLSLQALGQESGSAAVREVPAEERDRLLGLVFLHLERARETGWHDFDRLRSEPGLQAWKDDPRWKDLLARWGK